MFRPLRMLLQPLVVALVISSSSFSSSFAAAAPPTCKRLTDADSPFFSALAVLTRPHGMLSGVISVGSNPLPSLDPRVFAAVDKALPALSTCVAETNPAKLVASLMASPVATTCWQQLSLLDTTSSSTSGSNSNSGEGDNDGDTRVFHDDVCPAVATIAPCLTDVLVPALELAMAETHGCCDALTAQITGALGGETLHATVSSLVHVVGNALCTQRKHKGEMETCGDALVRNWMPPRLSNDDAKAVWAVLDAFQIPNNQVCKAVASEPFKTTTGKPQQYGAEKITPYGACYKPMDALLTYLRELPLWTLGGKATVATMTDLFGEARCLPGKQFVAWAADENGALLKVVRLADVVVSTVARIFGGVSPPPPPPLTMDASNNNSNSNSGDGEESSTDGSGSSDDHVEDNSGSGDQQEPGLFDPKGDDDDGEANDERLPPLKKTLTRRRLQDASNLVDVTKMLIGQLEFFTNSLCLHLPNGVTCESPGESLTTPFAATNSTGTGN